MAFCACVTAAQMIIVILRSEANALPSHEAHQPDFRVMSPVTRTISHIASIGK